MWKKSLLLLPLLAGASLFLTGPLRRAPADPASAATPAFLAQPVALAAELTPNIGAALLLDHAAERLTPERVKWLHVTVWQRMASAEGTFESEGSLQIGPDHCVRLDLTVRAGATPGRWLVVSDGHALAHVVQLAKGEPTVTSGLLVPDETDSRQPPPKPPAETLCDLGCGGPYPLLKDLRGKLRDLTVQTGLLQQRRCGAGLLLPRESPGQEQSCPTTYRPVARIQGRLDPAQPSTHAVSTDSCYLYLDAQTLWPVRLEWWGPDQQGGRRVLLEIELRDPELNRSLSLSECIRVFSYRPDPG